uniref:Uncharacterized protein n=1 Tax=Schistosoma curassoni TaxID=6186 RepID=A0A183JLF0_9TREM
MYSASSTLSNWSFLAISTREILELRIFVEHRF